MRSVVAISCLAVLGTTAYAQPRHQSPDWRVNVELSWSGVQPQRITLQTSGAGAQNFQTNTQPVRINYPVGNRLDDHRLIVHFPTVSHEFAVLPRDRQPTFNLRLTLPQGLQCDNSVVNRIAQNARSGDPELLASAGMAASYLLSLQTNVCGPGNTSRLREALVSSHCKLAENTTVFSVPDVPWRNFQPQVAQCRLRTRVRIVSEEFNQAGVQVAANRIEELDASLARLQEYSTSPSWSHAFTAARLDQDNLRHLEVQGLYNQAVPLRNAGNLEGAEPYAAQLALIARDPEYQEAFRRARLQPADAIDILAGIRESLSRRSLIENPGVTDPAGPHR